MKKYIIIFLSIIFISLIFYFYIYNTKTKQVTNEKSIEEIAKGLQQELIAYKKNLDQKILFYKNDIHAGPILENLYLEKGRFCRQDKKYNKADECFKKALRLAQKSGNKDNEALAAWNLVWIAALQDKTDLVLSLNSKFENIIKPRFCGVFMPSYFYYYWVGQAYLNKNNLEKAAKYLDSGLKAINSKSSRLIKHHALLICASSILASKKHNLQKALKYLKKVADSFYSFNSKYEKKQTKCFYEALAVFERCNPPNNLELSALYETIASVYAYDNEVKFKEYIFKAIRVLKAVNASNEKIATLYFKIGSLNYEPNNKYFEECIKLLKDIKNEDAAKIIFEIALHNYDESSKESLRLLLLSLKTRPKSDEKPSWVARAYHLIAHCYNERKEWRKSAEYSKKCLKLVKENTRVSIRSTLTLDCYSFLDDFYRSHGDINKRIKNAEDAIIFMRDIKAELFMLNAVYEELGKIYKLAKRYSDAEKSYRKIIEIIDKNPKLKENAENHKDEITAYCEIGNLCLYQEAKEKALAAFNKASKLMTKKIVIEFSEWYTANTFRSIADGYFYLKEYHLAEKTYQRAIVLEAKANNNNMTVILFELYDMLGLTYLKLQKYEKSRFYYYKLLSFSKKKYGEKSYFTASNYVIIAHSYYYEKKYDKAVEYFQKGIKVLEQLDDKKSVLARVYIDLAHTFRKQKNKELTLKYLNLAYKIFKELPSSDPQFIVSLRKKIIHNEPKKELLDSKLFKKLEDQKKELKW